MAKRNKRKNGASAADDRLDRGTSETRRRLSPDPLLSPTLDPHRAAAGLLIRQALEEGVGAKGLDVIRIGMTAGAMGSGGYNQPLPLERLIQSREWLAAWRRACGRKGIRTTFAEDFSGGTSIRQIAVAHVLSRHRVTEHVNNALDIYADLRGLRAKQKPSGRILSAVIESFPDESGEE
jgi:hypothetical protein